MAILSKFLEGASTASGIPLIGISRMAYIAAVAGYIFNVAIPEWKRKKCEMEASQTKGDDDENVQALAKKVSNNIENESLKPPKSPAVNRYNLHHFPLINSNQNVLSFP